MSIRFNCPGCSKKLQAKDEMVGKRIKCSACTKVIEVPVQPSNASAPTQSDDLGAENQPLLPWVITALSVLLLVAVSIMWLLSGRQAQTLRSDLAKATADAETANAELAKTKAELAKTKTEIVKADPPKSRLFGTATGDKSQGLRLTVIKDDGSKRIISQASILHSSSRGYLIGSSFQSFGGVYYTLEGKLTNHRLLRWSEMRKLTLLNYVQPGNADYQKAKIALLDESEIDVYLWERKNGHEYDVFHPLFVMVTGELEIDGKKSPVELRPVAPREKEAQHGKTVYWKIRSIVFDHEPSKE